MTIDYEIFDNVSPSDNSWVEWKEFVYRENWKGADFSVMALTPILQSTNVVVAKDRDGNFIGSVVWNEYDNLAFVGYYLLRPDQRGKGVGSAIWKRAMQRMANMEIIALRATPAMRDRYLATDLPIPAYDTRFYEINAKILLKMAEKHNHLDETYSIRTVKSLNEHEYDQLLRFDQELTGRDRSELVRQFFNFSYTDGRVLRDSEGKIIAFAALCPTYREGSHLYKLAPLYARNLEDAMTVVTPLITALVEKDSEASISFHLIGKGIGFKLLTPMLEEIHPERKMTYTLTNKPFSNPIDFDRVFIPHNHYGYFDA